MVYSEGIVGYGGVSDTWYTSNGALPVLNLKSDVKITNFDTADGSIDKPYELGL